MCPFQKLVSASWDSCRCFLCICYLVRWFVPLSHIAPCVFIWLFFVFSSVPPCHQSFFICPFLLFISCLLLPVPSCYFAQMCPICSSAHVHVVSFFTPHSVKHVCALCYARFSSVSPWLIFVSSCRHFSFVCVCVCWINLSFIVFLTSVCIPQFKPLSLWQMYNELLEKM